MKKHPHWITTTVILASLLILPAPAAESLSVLLQRAIFAEETEGNLDAAITIYERIAAETAANRSVATQAQFRLAVCYQKKGSNDQAIGVLRGLLQQFPTDLALTQKARARLTELGQPSTGGVTLRKLPFPTSRLLSVSRDGRFVAFQPPQVIAIAIHDVETGRTWTALKFKDGEIVQDVSISPDGQRIAYAPSRSKAISVANIDGTETRVVFELESPISWLLPSSLEWLPGGEELIVSIASEKSQTASTGILDIETGAMREIMKRPLVGDSYQFWRTPVSSNGRYLCYRAGSGGDHPKTIKLRELATGRETLVVEKEAGDIVGWSPDDSKILFLSSRTGTKDLWAIAVRDGKESAAPELVRSNLGELSVRCNALDGKIYCTEIRSDHNVFLAEAVLATGEIVTPPHRATDRFLGEQSRPVWSKDGNKVLFVTLGDRARFVALTLASGDIHEYPVDQVFSPVGNKFAWSEKGGFVLVQAGHVPTGASGIHRYELASGKTETLVTMRDTPDRDWNSHPQLAPDGTSFYYSRRKFIGEAPYSTDRIVRRDLRSGKEETAFEPAEHMDIYPYPFELSPDGSRFAINISSTNGRSRDNAFNTIKLVSIQGQVIRELVRTAIGESVIFLSWTPDGKRLVYTKQSAAKDANGLRSTEVWSISTDAGEPVKLRVAQTGIGSFRVHPDGRHVVYSARARDNVEELWIMEGLFVSAVASNSR